MNINNFKAAEFTPTWLKDIFDKQQKLLDKYKDIEKMPALPVSIHTHEGQKWIKDFLWRVTEELGESYEAQLQIQVQDQAYDADVFMDIDQHQKLVAQYEVHQIEELIDALHFIVELIIIVGKDWQWARDLLNDNDEKRVLGLSKDISQDYWEVAYWLGMVGNTLKNKPWKQTQMQTDDKKFYRNLGYAFVSLFNCLAELGYDEREVFSFYDRKNQVNTFRQRSKY